MTVTKPSSSDGIQQQELAGSEAIDPKRELAIAALLTERTVGAAAAAVGIGERTLHRWLAEDDFKREYQAAGRRVLDATIARLRAASGKALDVLLELADGADSDSVRRAAARDVLDMAHRFESDELAARIERLEAQHDAKTAS